MAQHTTGDEPAIKLPSIDIPNGREPGLSDSNLRRLGKVQMAFLRWLADRDDWVTMLAAWEWVHYTHHGYPAPPPWRKTSKKAERLRALSRFSTHALGRLIRSLMKRGLIDLMLFDGEDHARIKYTGK